MKDEDRLPQPVFGSSNVGGSDPRWYTTEDNLYVSPHFTWNFIQSSSSSNEPSNIQMRKEFDGWYVYTTNSRGFPEWAIPPGSGVGGFPTKGELYMNDIEAIKAARSYLEADKIETEARERNAQEDSRARKVSE